jgi:ADP-dependent NAD(P)H-hydrate dehydratase
MSPSSRGETLNAQFLRRWPLPPIDAAGGKDSRGSVLIVGGSPQMPGAVVLAATAALRGGAGKLQVATGRSVAAFVAMQVPEALVIALPETRAGGLSPACARDLAKRAEGMSSVLLGPGMIDTSAAGRLAVELCGRLEDVTLVLDAEALECCSLEPRAVAQSEARVAITPHAKEMAHALGLSPADVQRDPRKTAMRAAAELKAAVVLKGAVTYLADASGRLIRNRQAGNPGLGTSGTGDVLSGILAGLAARGADPLQAAAWAVYVHGRSADVLARDIGPIGYLARELLPGIPRELARLAQNKR